MVKYTDYTGSNDIVAAKVIHDTEYVYFYVETDKDIVRNQGSSAWMQLFLNTGGDAAPLGRLNRIYRNYIAS